jgi:LPXTG-motif cell wall-anchored protein
LENTIGYAYNMSSVPSNTYFYNAGNANALTTAFTNILKSINESIGAKNVHMHDDITGLTSVGISTVSSGSGEQYSGFKYTRSGGAYGTGQEWAEAPSATFVDTGTPDPDHPERNEKYVEWDLGDSMMEDSVTYTVSFTVWPSQEAYNMVADSNNGIRTWDSLTVDEKNQVLENPAGSGKYELRTNPPSAENYNEITYDKVRSEILDTLPDGAQYDTPITDGNITTVYTRNSDGTVTKTETTHSTTAFNDPDKNMKLEDTISKVMKKWNSDLQLRQFVEYLYDTDSGNSKEIKIPFVLNQDTEIYGNPIMLGWDQAGTGTGYTWSDTTSEVTIGENTYTIGTEWTKRFDIAVGLILDRDNAILHGLDVDHDDGKYTKVTYQNEDYYMLEPGHDYYINEPAVAQLLGYRFDFSTRRYHPMLVNGVLKSVTIENGVVTDVYPGGTRALGALVGENTLRGGINLHKILLDENGNPIPESTQVDDEFSFTITLVNTAKVTKTILEEDGSMTTTTTDMFVGDNIPWYSVNGNYYHDDEGNYYEEDGEGRSGNIMFTEDGQTATTTLNIKRTDTVRIANVPAGTEFTIVETPRSDYDFVRASRGVSGTTVYDKTVTVPTIDGEIVPNKEMNVAFTNKKANKYRIDILKKDVTSNLPLSGVVFELYGDDYYVKDGHGQPTSTVNEEAVPLQQNLTSNADGEIGLGELISGIYYLVETHAPDGYNQTNPIKITVDKNSTITKEVEEGVVLPLYVTYHQDGYSGSDNNDGIEISVFTVETSDGPVTNYSYTLTVMNNPGVSLPETGGHGTTMFYLFGIMLAGVAGAGLIRRKFRRAA